jgi:hypothetical protein
MKVVPSPQDGHCILHAVSSSVYHFLDISLPVPHILSKLYEESMLNISEYSPFVHNDSNISFHNGLVKYVFDKIYNTNYVNIVPMILCNALNMVIFIVEGNHVHHIVYPTTVQITSNTKCIAIQKSGEHYDGLQCIDINRQKPACSEHVSDSLITNLKNLRNDHPKNIIATHVNINSLRNKFCDVDDLLSNGLTDIFCISETKLNNEFSDELFRNCNFKMYRKDWTKTSGGLVMYVRNDIPQTRLSKLEFSPQKSHIESLAVELTFKGNKWLIMLAYKHPKVPMRTFVNLLDAFYRDNYSKYKEIVLLCDSNINVSQSNIMSSEILNIYDLKNLIIGPTCFKTPSGTDIDQILVKNKRHFHSHINLKCGFSDYHNIVGCITRLEMPPQIPITKRYRSYKTFNESTFKNDVEMLPFQVGKVFDDIDDQYWFQSTLLRDLIDSHAPIKLSNRKNEHIPYMTSNLRKEMYRRNMYRNQYFSQRNCKFLEKRFKKQRNKVTSMRRDAIKSYFSSHCSENSKPGDFWKCIKPFLSKNIKSERNMILRETIKENDTITEHIVTDKQDICNIFNTFFTSVANNIGKDDSIDINSECVTDVIGKHTNHPSITAIKSQYKRQHIFTFHEVTEKYIKLVLKKINPAKSTGFDDIPPKLVKLASDELSSPITELVNASIRELVYPHDMKKAEVSPLYKVQKENDMLKENYRPVSILPILGKVLEIVMADQLRIFFNDIFDVKLGAYRKRYGCDNILVRLLEKWKKALDENKIVGTLLMDLSKAFDCIPHSLLVSKLHAYGVSESACQFITSYLTNRYQRIKIQSKRSLWSLLTKGVPQGSVLGPILFNIFINDLFLFIETCDICNYADDNTLSFSSNTLEALVQALQTDAHASIDWFKNNYMQANADKFQVMFMKPMRSKVKLPEIFTLENEKLESKKCVNLLGVTIDDKLNFDEHISSLCKKAARQLNVMFRFHKLLDFNRKLQLYRAFVLSNFNFCPIVWHFSSITNMRQIDKIQERALRFLTGDHKSTYEQLRKQLGIDCLYLKRIKEIVIEVYKTVNKINPEFMHDIFVAKDTSHNFRDGHILRMPNFNTIQYGKMSFAYYGAHLWNLLPNHFKSSINFNTFKRLLKDWDGPKCSCTSCSILQSV